MAVTWPRRVCVSAGHPAGSGRSVHGGRDGGRGRPAAGDRRDRPRPFRRLVTRRPPHRLLRGGERRGRGCGFRTVRRGVAGTNPPPPPVGPLEGTPATRPNPPAGTRQRRLTFTHKRPAPGRLRARGTGRSVRPTARSRSTGGTPRGPRAGVPRRRRRRPGAVADGRGPWSRRPRSVGARTAPGSPSSPTAACGRSASADGRPTRLNREGRPRPHAPRLRVLAGRVADRLRAAGRGVRPGVRRGGVIAARRVPTTRRHHGNRRRLWRLRARPTAAGFGAAGPARCPAISRAYFS